MAASENNVDPVSRPFAVENNKKGYSEWSLKAFMHVFPGRC
jgi:hypothetical protein